MSRFTNGKIDLSNKELCTADAAIYSLNNVYSIPILTSLNKNSTIHPFHLWSHNKSKQQQLKMWIALTLDQFGKIDLIIKIDVSNSYYFLVYYMKQSINLVCNKCRHSSHKGVPCNFILPTTITHCETCYHACHSFFNSPDHKCTVPLELIREQFPFPTKKMK